MWVIVLLCIMTWIATGVVPVVLYAKYSGERVVWGDLIIVCLQGLVCGPFFAIYILLQTIKYSEFWNREVFKRNK